MNFIFFLLLSSFLFHRAWAENRSTHPNKTIPAVIIFGDSIVDTGNNNALNTLAKSNFPPYGINFPGHLATGRFCDGKVPSDFIVSKVGVKEYLPPYLKPGLLPSDLLTGVSFASGGAGFDPLTSELALVISMPQQLEMFREYKQHIAAIAGEETAASIINGSIYVVCAGSDDVANTYFSTPFRSTKYDFQSYADFLVSSAISFLQELIGEGARRIGVVGVPPIGCAPSQRTLNGGVQRNCASGHNQLAQIYNNGIANAIQALNANYTESSLVYIDVYSILLDIIQRPYSYGFEVSTKGCCGTGNIEVAFLCNSLMATVCNNISEYVFWDSYHPTEKAYRVLVDWVYENYKKFLT